ncbi:uncharacterized protein LOC141721296 [Apium graveolens]|uniref:uncharacterized protein LOC141721296 n=1 Tax=Apium graveolens TaxID=4045 RepID=UPI003D79F35D
MEHQSKMEEPLISGGGESEKWSSYQHVGRSGSLLPTSSLAGTQVSVDEIRSASTVSDLYPPSLHAPLISSPEPYPNDQAIAYQGSYGGAYGTSSEFQRQTLDEVEIRELLIDHVGHRCCWGSRPARAWKIQAVEDCNVYIGTLETFVEERETFTESEAYLSGNKFQRDTEPEQGLWELDLRSEFPVLFTPYKESRTQIPHSESVVKCSDCGGRGDLVCPSCNADQEHKMTKCLSCYGRGLIAHRDGSDTICIKCKGKGQIPCVTCGSGGLVKCRTCSGSGSILTRKLAVVKWKTASTRKVSATSGAASVPDEVFHKARGVQLCNTQAYQCTPAFFADSYFLNKFSSEVIADRAPVAPTARIICERHTISVIPVTRVTMKDHNRSFSFYIIGFSREVYLKDYYPARFCWGLCPCLEWIKI